MRYLKPISIRMALQKHFDQSVRKIGARRVLYDFIFFNIWDKVTGELENIYTQRIYTRIVTEMMCRACKVCVCMCARARVFFLCYKTYLVCECTREHDGDDDDDTESHRMKSIATCYNSAILLEFSTSCYILISPCSERGRSNNSDNFT